MRSGSPCSCTSCHTNLPLSYLETRLCYSHCSDMHATIRLPCCFNWGVQVNRCTRRLKADLASLHRLNFNVSVTCRSHVSRQECMYHHNQHANSADNISMQGSRLQQSSRIRSAGLQIRSLAELASPCKDLQNCLHILLLHLGTVTYCQNRCCSHQLPTVQ